MGPGCSRRVPPAEVMRAYADFHCELTCRLESRDYHVLTSNAMPHLAGPTGRNESGIPKLLQQHHVGALVVVGDIWSELHREITRLRLPTVGIYCESAPDVPTVDMNYQAAARHGTQHLLELGHRRIAFVPGQWKTWKTEPMQLGYLAALGEAGVRPLPGWDQFRDSVEVAVDRMQRRQAPTALVVYDDYEAVRIIDRLVTQGIRAPDHVSIVAVQNMGPGALRQPTVSGCPIPAVAMARRAVDVLMNQLNDRQRAGGRDELIDAPFVSAASSKHV